MFELFEIMKSIKIKRLVWVITDIGSKIRDYCRVITTLYLAFIIIIYDIEYY